MFSVLSCGFSAEQDVGSNNNVQSFTHLGDFHPHVSYAHMGMEISFSPFQQYISLLRKTLKAVEHGDLHVYGKATFARLLAALDRTQERHDDYFNFFLCSSHASNSRPKRQFLAAAGVGLGLLAMMDAESLRSTVGEVQS